MDINPKFRREIWAGVIKLGVVSLQMLFKAMRPDKVTKGVILEKSLLVPCQLIVSSHVLADLSVFHDTVSKQLL